MNKTTICTLLLSVFLVSAHAQDAPSPEKNFLPETGDLAFGISANSLFNYAGTSSVIRERTS